MGGPMSAPEFPGAVGLTAMAAYDWESVDGEHGGSPHLHLVCTEAYVVTGGRGRLQTLTTSGFAETPLAAGDVVWFTPGAIHRALNDEDLSVVVVMQNGGLPEAGDAVMTFPPEHLTSPESYAAAASLLVDGVPSADRARTRRDLAIEGFLELRRRTEAGDPAAFVEFLAAAAALVRSRLDDWRALVGAGAERAALATLDQLDALAVGDASHLAGAEVARIARPQDTTYGMCGHLRAYDPIRRDLP